MNGRSAAFVAVVALLSACQPAPVPSPDLDEAELSALRATDDKALDAMGSGDWATYGTMVTDNVRWMVPDGRTLEGWNAVEGFVKQFERVNGLSYSNRQFWGSGNLAYRTGDYVMRADVVGSEDELVYPGKIVTIYRRGADGNWRIETEIWNATPTS